MRCYRQMNELKEVGLGMATIAGCLSGIYKLVLHRSPAPQRFFKLMVPRRTSLIGGARLAKRLTGRDHHK
jgi:hypothetical protein